MRWYHRASLVPFAGISYSFDQATVRNLERRIWVNIAMARRSKPDMLSKRSKKCDKPVTVPKFNQKRIVLINHETLRNDIKGNVCDLVKRIEVSISGLSERPSTRCRSKHRIVPEAYSKTKILNRSSRELIRGIIYFSYWVVQINHSWNQSVENTLTILKNYPENPPLTRTDPKPINSLAFKARKSSFCWMLSDRTDKGILTSLTCYF